MPLLNRLNKISVKRSGAGRMKNFGIIIHQFIVGNLDVFILPFSRLMAHGYKKSSGRDYFILIFKFSFRILLVFIFFLPHFFCQLTFPVTMEHWPGAVFTKTGGDIFLVDIKTDNNKRVIEALRGKGNQQQKSQEFFQKNIFPSSHKSTATATDSESITTVFKNNLREKIELISFIDP